MSMHLFNRRPACFIVLVLLFLNSGICASKGPVVSLGELDGFWRYSAALGPFHEVGQGLTDGGNQGPHKIIPSHYCLDIRMDDQFSGQEIRCVSENSDGSF